MSDLRGRLEQAEQAVQRGSECQECNRLTFDIGLCRIYGLALKQTVDADGNTTCTSCGRSWRVAATPQEDTRIRELVENIYGVSRSDRFMPQDDDGGWDDADVT